MSTLTATSIRLLTLVDETPVESMQRLIAGSHVNQAVSVAATLGIADLLADGPRVSDELAVATDTHAPSLSPHADASRWRGHRGRTGRKLYADRQERSRDGPEPA
jgi:hypothetical protein